MRINVNAKPAAPITSTPYNEYLERWERSRPHGTNWSQFFAVSDPHTVGSIRERDVCVRQYSFAIPNQEALDVLAAHGPIVEIGAGTGYWAYLLRQMGVHVVALDRAPLGSDHENAYNFTKSWTHVEFGLPPDLARYGDHALFLCWPNYDTPFAAEALAAYPGQTCIYIGEGWGGCTGDDTFHEMLDQHWTRQRRVTIPQWSSIHDELYVFTRTVTP